MPQFTFHRQMNWIYKKVDYATVVIYNCTITRVGRV